MPDEDKTEPINAKIDKDLKGEMDHFCGPKKKYKDRTHFLTIAIKKLVSDEEEKEKRDKNGSS